MSSHQFNPSGLVLFRILFNVDTATAAGFNRFIEDVERRLRRLIQWPRLHGTGTMVLPPPQDERTWFVIELESQDNSVPFFIEAETIYLRGYQNQNGDLFEFAREKASDNLPPPQPYLGTESKALTFSCNYLDLQRSSRQRKEEVPKEVPRPNFGQQRLKVAVRELAEEQNLPRQSQHRTAQNLLLVIVRFCESIRFRSIRAEMVDLWTVQSSTGQPSRCLSKHCFGQINNWNKLGINLQDSARLCELFWPADLANKTGVGSATQAKEILVVVLFREYPDEPGNPIPEWDRNPPDNNNNRRGHGGGGGAAGGVLAAELPVTRWLPVPQQPVMKILGVYVPRQPGLQGVYGTVTVDDGLGAQAIFRRSRVNYQRYSGDSKMTLELNVLDRSVSAFDSWCIDVDLWSASTDTDAPLSTGRITWSICDFSSNTYDRVMRKTIDQAVVEYVVYSRAMEVAAVVDGVDDIRFELLGPESSTAPADYFRYDVVDDNVTSDTSSSAGRHDEL